MKFYLSSRCLLLLNADKIMTSSGLVVSGLIVKHVILVILHCTGPFVYKYCSYKPCQV